MPIKSEHLDELLAGYEKPEDLVGENGLFKQLKKALLERALGAELTHHRSVSAPASDVIAPASNAATTARPSTASNPKKSGLHSVGIGALRESSTNCCGTTVFADSQPRCTQVA
jgi:hypothetical protein